MDPVMRRRGGVWLGWAGRPELGDAELQEALASSRVRFPYGLRAVPLDERERELYYTGISNRVLWPLFHGLVQWWERNGGSWEVYREVNRRFARALAETARWDDLIWVHDYHLLLVGRELRRLGLAQPLGFFLHIPFPSPRLLSRLPWHRELISDLLEFDLVGFQQERDRRHFLEAVHAFAPDALDPGSGSPDPVVDGRVVRVGAFPISIDVDEFHHASHGREIEEQEEEILEGLPGRSLVLGVDRLDYTKGIEEKIRGFRRFLERRADLRGRIVLRQLVVPCRSGIAAYARTRKRVEDLVGSVNRELGDGEWSPVDYRFGRWNRPELLAHYRAARIALVTPLADGMNLVAKEFCTANPGNGVLVLSTRAGAAEELADSAVLVDPTSADDVARGLESAWDMPECERARRLEVAQDLLRTHDVHRWVGHFLEEATRVS
jgi:trehalose 6-phosphate synthase/phosphatase